MPRNMPTHPTSEWSDDPSSLPTTHTYTCSVQHRQAKAQEVMLNEGNTNTASRPSVFIEGLWPLVKFPQLMRLL